MDGKNGLRFAGSRRCGSLSQRVKAVIQVSVSNPKEFEELFSISSKSGSEPAKPPKSLRDRLIEEVTKEKKPPEKKCEQDTRVCISSNEKSVSGIFR